MVTIRFSRKTFAATYKPLRHPAGQMPPNKVHSDLLWLETPF